MREGFLVAFMSTSVLALKKSLSKRGWEILFILVRWITKTLQGDCSVQDNRLCQGQWEAIIPNPESDVRADGFLNAILSNIALPPQKVQE
jgi:hypothetical protein